MIQFFRSTDPKYFTFSVGCEGEHYRYRPFDVVMFNGKFYVSQKDVGISKFYTIQAGEDSNSLIINKEPYQFNYVFNDVHSFKSFIQRKEQDMIDECLYADNILKFLGETQ